VEIKVKRDVTQIHKYSAPDSTKKASAFSVLVTMVALPISDRKKRLYCLGETPRVTLTKSKTGIEKTTDHVRMTIRPVAQRFVPTEKPQMDHPK
jgi:hypothetical protein